MRKPGWGEDLPRRAAAPAFLILCLVAAASSAITRDRVMARAKAFAFHPWHCTAANQTASCDPTYTSSFPVGDYLGLPYDWGGYMSLFDFDQQIADGYGAGSPPYGDILACTSGLDCSGFVSQCWDVSYHTTSMIPDITSEIPIGSMLAGDAFNSPGYHVVLYSHTLMSGQPVFYESLTLVHMNTYGGWSHVEGYTPSRLSGIEGTSAGDPAGTTTSPIVIGSFPYSDTRSTSDSASDVFDGCAAASATDESGPEFVYQVTFAAPGTLTVSVEDDVGIDIDVHLYTSMNTSDCVARNDTTLTYPVDCGTYFIVADTYMQREGYYTLTVDFSPSGGGCGSGPPAYDFLGGPGDACADLPFCNPNTGVDTCLYGLSYAFCTKACTGPSDCADFPGGCCADVGLEEYYCLTADFCEPPPPDEPVVPDAATDPDVIIVPDDGTDLFPDPAEDTAAPDAVLPDEEETALDSIPDEGLPDDGTIPPPEEGGGGCSCAAAS